MPNDWIMGAVTSVFVDAQDHVWVTHLRETLTEEETGAVQDPPTRLCCVPAPIVVEFDAEGEVVQAWGTRTRRMCPNTRGTLTAFLSTTMTSCGLGRIDTTGS